VIVRLAVVQIEVFILRTGGSCWGLRSGRTGQRPARLGQ
jgi:hypothetical protein